MYISTMKRVFSILVTCIILTEINAQSAGQILEKLRDSFPQEKIHIHFDRQAYKAGETIWFKAYLFNGFQLSELSTNFFVDLLDEEGIVIASKKLPIIGSAVSGSITLPESLTTGHYLFRAYTPWMLNFDPSFVYQQGIYIYSSVATGNIKKAESVSKNHFYLFPESGHLVGGLVNVVAFKGTDPYGQPVQVSGRLMDESGSEIASFESVHDGLGSFGFLPQAGQKYSVQVNYGDGTNETIAALSIESSGWLLQVREESKTRQRIQVLTAKGQEAIPLVLVGQMQQQLVLEQPIILQNAAASISFNTGSLPTGILQLTLLTEKGVPIAERLVFINNQDFQLPVELTTDTLSLIKKGKNVIHFNLPDSLSGTFSVSIVDDERTFNEEPKDDIVSRFLLTGDLKGYIHQPSFYLRNNEKTTRAYLDLLMMTHGWRRFNWEKTWSQQFPVIKYWDRNHIEISGLILSDRTKKPVTDGVVNFLYRTKDSVTDLIQTEVGEDGRFFLENLTYSDTATFSFLLNSKKTKEKELSIQLDKDTMDFSKMAGPLLQQRSRELLYRPYLLPDSLRVSYTFAGDTTGNYKLLKSVIVTAKKKRPLDELNRRYTTGLFASTNMVRILDLVNNYDGAGSLNVFQYIQGRLPGIMVQSRGFPPTYTVYSRRAMNITKGLLPIPLFLDEVSADAAQLANIPMNQVAMIKYFQTGFMGNTSQGTSQAIAVYTRKPGDRKDLGYSYLKSFSYPGYSPVKEYFTPDYESSAAARALPDRRITLLWQPSIEPEEGTSKYVIRFFNNDYAKKVHLVLEGVTTNGKLIREEKWLQ